MHVMPPPNLCFAALPAKIDDSTVHVMRKVTQSHVQVLDEDSHFLDRLEVFAQLLKGRNIDSSGVASASEARFRTGLLDFLLHAAQYLLGSTDLGQVPFKFWDETIRLREGKHPLQILAF